MPTWATCNEEQLSTFGKTSRMIMDFLNILLLLDRTVSGLMCKKNYSNYGGKNLPSQEYLHKPDRIGRILRETRETMLSFMATSQHMHLNLRKSIPTSRKHFVRIQEVSNTSGKCPIWNFFKLGGIRMSAMDSTTTYHHTPRSWIHKLHQQGRKQWSDQQLHVLWSEFDLTKVYLWFELGYKDWKIKYPRGTIFLQHEQS